MKKTGIIILGVFAAIFMSITVFGMSMLGQRNNAVTLEEMINAQHVANKSNYDAMWKTIKEMTQVTELQAEQFKDVYFGLIEGRYEDENLLFKSIQEQNPELDKSVYTNLQTEISAGRKTFDNNQKKIADMIREYNTYIKKKFIMAAITGRQPLDANKYVVTSDRTDNAFNEGKDEEINILGD